MASQLSGCGFLGIEYGRVDAVLTFRELSVLLGHVFTQAKYPAVKKPAGKVLLIQRIHTSLG